MARAQSQVSASAFRVYQELALAGLRCSHMCWHQHGDTKAWLGSCINNLELTIQITMKMYNKRSRLSASWQANGCTNADAVAVADVT